MYEICYNGTVWPCFILVLLIANVMNFRSAREETLDSNKPHKKIKLKRLPHSINSDLLQCKMINTVCFPNSNQPLFYAKFNISFMNIINMRSPKSSYSPSFSPVRSRRLSQSPHFSSHHKCPKFSSEQII